MATDGFHTIPDYGALPANACHWPRCANPVCQRECPLEDDLIVACSRCGCAVGASTLKCPVCDAASSK